MRNRRQIKSSIEDLSDLQFLYPHSSKQSYYLFLTDKMECFIKISNPEHLKTWKLRK